MGLDNSVLLEGNLTKDPELRFTPSGTSVVTVGLAVNKRYQDSTGAWQERTSFFDGVAWAQMAENITASLSKGDRVVISGELVHRTWETTPTDGSAPERRSKVEVKITGIGPSLRFATIESIVKNERPGASADDLAEAHGVEAPKVSVPAGAPEPDEDPFAG